MKQDNSQHEQVLIHQILDGRVEDYSYFVTHYQQDVLAFILRMDVPVTEAEELAQDTFVRAYRGLNEFAGKSSFSTWLLRIAHRVTLNHLGRRRLSVVSMDSSSPQAIRAFAEAEYTTALNDELDTAFSTGREERIQLLEAAILKLPPDDQLLLRLYYYEGQPLTDIAFILDMSAGALSTRLHRIRKRLQKDMRE